MRLRRRLGRRDLRLANAIGWFGPAGLAFCVIGVASPTAATAALALAVGTTASLGVGHGALDHELLERLRGTSRSTTLRVAVAYAVCVGTGFVAFLAAPLVMMPIFLVVSVFHFGAADVAFVDRYARVRPVRDFSFRQIALGAFPIVIPVLAHPQAALAFFPYAHSIGALLSGHWAVARCVALGAAGIAVIVVTRARNRDSATPVWYRYELAIAFAAFILAPPVVAFFTYFGAWHAARHALRLAEAYGIDPNAAFPSQSTWRLVTFASRSLPMTVAAVAAAGGLCLLLVHSAPPILVFAALAFGVTVPHTFAVRFFNYAVASIGAQASTARMESCAAINN